MLFLSFSNLNYLLNEYDLTLLIGKSKSISQIKPDDNEDGVYEISSGDEDETTGMKSMYFQQLYLLYM